MQILLNSFIFLSYIIQIDVKKNNKKKSDKIVFTIINVTLE